MSTKALIVPLPNVTDSVTIAAAWFDKRDAAIAAIGRFEVVDSDDDFEGAAEVLQAATKLSNGLEKTRQALSRPFTQAGKVIKKASDTARAPLEDAKKALQNKMNAYAARKAREAEEARRAAEEEARRQAEEQLAAAQADADLFGDGEVEVFEADLPPAPVIPDRVVTSSVRTTEVVTWDVEDESAIPRAFLMLDPRKVNEYVRERKAELVDVLKLAEAGEDIPSPVRGIRFTLERKVISR